MRRNVRAAEGLLRNLLLAGDGDGLALAGACVGMGALTMHRQAAAMAQPTLAAQVHEPLDVHRHLAPQVALDAVILVNHLAQLQHFVV